MARRVSACRLELYEHDVGNWRLREVDGKHAPCVRQVARIELTTVGFGPPSAEPEPNAQAGSIGASLLERAEQFVDVPTGKAPASYSRHQTPSMRRPVTIGNRNLGTNGAS